MEKKCYTCAYEDFTLQQYPCLRCQAHSHWEQKEEKKDSKQLWSELMQMYCRALGESEGVDYDTYDIQCDRFREKLSELCEAIKEECW